MHADIHTRMYEEIPLARTTMVQGLPAQGQSMGQGHICAPYTPRGQDSFLFLLAFPITTVTRLYCRCQQLTKMDP